MTVGPLYTPYLTGLRSRSSDLGEETCGRGYTRNADRIANEDELFNPTRLAGVEATGASRRPSCFAWG